MNPGGTESAGSGSERRAGRRAKLLLVLGALVGTFAVLELGLRLFGPSYAAPPLRFRFANRLDAALGSEEGLFEASETLFWDLAPGARVPHGGDRINPQRMRGPERALAASPGVFRIALLGDSCTYGMGVELEQTYAVRLEELLRAEAGTDGVEVLNGGVPGYSLVQGAAKFEQQLAPYAPQLVIAYLGAWNDFGPAMGASDRAQRAGARTRLQRWNELLLRSRVIEALQARYGSALRYRHWRATLDEWLVQEPSGGYRVPPEDFAQTLQELLDACSAAGARALLILPELNADYGEDHPRAFERLERYRNLLREGAQRNGAATLDQREVYRLAGHPPERLFLDVVHPSALGQDLLADALARTIQAQGWIAEQD